ncbi:hypothetical protein T459_16937 [Capsicum annuum]|uniref:RNA-dependent RNA polymerase n=1 Tax=Capsicum annuum TaxID=4072 RepID=A0A2G2ZAI8_CAPAN|nr:hypothetical protein T459_16937 [Capsicum annuum]
MGLCFSSTYETIKVPSSQVSNLPEIIRNNYVFSDGIGKISASLAAKEAMLAAFDAKLAIDIRRSSAETINAIATMVAADGRLLMGCLDELGILEDGQCCIRVSSSASYPEIHDINFEIIQGKKGNRPHADETSGSDLDGDLYFVTWNENLIPVEAVEPMIYDSTKIDEFHGKVEDKDLIDFFLRYIIEDNLGSMSNAHLMQAHQYGAKNSTSIKLTDSISKALDCSKTEDYAAFPKILKPKSYPHYMEKKGVKTYLSTNILGKLYDQIKDVITAELPSRVIQ